MHGIRRGRNPPKFLQFLVQFFQIEIRQTDILDAFRCLFRIPAQAAFQYHPVTVICRSRFGTVQPVKPVIIIRKPVPERHIP